MLGFGMPQVGEDTLTRIKEALELGDLELLEGLLQETPALELIEHWDELSGEHQFVLLTLLPPPKAAEVLSQLDPEDQLEFLDTLPRFQVRGILEHLDPDDLADLLQAAREERPALFEELLSELDDETRAEVERLLAYEEDEAGGLMTPEYVAVKGNMTVEEVLEFLRRAAPDAETIYYIYVVDDAGRLLGVVSLRDLIVADPHVRVKEIMNENVVYVTTETDQEEVARLMADYDFTVLPVVDEDQRLVGIVTIDDVIDVLEEEATEDIYRLGAVEAPELVYSKSNVLELWSARVRWLVILILTGMVTSTILGGFEDVLKAVTALSFYLPVLLGTGGNSGSQAATIIVRALGTKDVEIEDWPKILFKEVGVGFLLGLTLSALIAAKVVIDGHLEITAVVALALFLLVIVANLAGSLLPLLLAKLGVDPALISNPLIATVSDISGLLIYLSVARLLLGV